jgi:flagellar biosynthesis GTPase FlhF
MAFSIMTWRLSMTVRRHIALGVAVLAVTLTVAFAADLLGELGFTEQAVKDHILLAFVSGSVPIAGSGHAFKIAPPDKKVLFVKAVTGLAKAYSQTADFKSQYAEYREANKPQPPVDLEAFDDQQAAQAREFEENLKRMQQELKSLPPDQQKEMQKVIDEMRKETAAAKQDPKMKAAYEDIRKQSSAENAAAHQQRLKEWEQRYPEDPNGLIANRLREFLSETKDLDYAAKLVKQGEKMRFADAKCEEESSEWKLCFRAGREATGAARVFAAEWLKELQAKGAK